MSDESDLLTRIECFLSTTGMKPTTFGLKAVNDRNLIAQLKKSEPRELRRRTRAKIESFLAEQTQQGAA